MEKIKRTQPIPMPPFPSIQAAVDKLSGYVHTQVIKEQHQKGRTGIVEASVSGNIFRAFRNMEVQPSLVYRQWAVAKYEEIHSQIKTVKNQEEYDKIILRHSYKLIDWWDSQCENKNLRIGFGPASKMLNLLIKSIQQYKSDQIKGLEEFMHVPFDLYTLAPLRLIINGLTDVHYNIPISQYSTMKFVVNEELYQVLQYAIRRLSIQAKRNPIIFDYMCWNNQH